MNIFNFDAGIGRKVFPKFSDKNIHAACCEITVFSPDFTQCGFAWQQFVLVLAQKPSKVGFFGRKFLFSPFAADDPEFGIELIGTYGK